MKKGVKILIAVIAVMVVLAGTFAGLFFGGIIDYMKPARKTWTKQVQKALNLDGVKQKANSGVFVINNTIKTLFMYDSEVLRKELNKYKG